MKCIGLVDSGNYAFFLNDFFSQKGIETEVIPAPCAVATSGCSYCLTFSRGHLERIVQGCRQHGMPLRQVYLVKNGSRSRYERML